jgi:ketosteroid isomerase-like protein
MAFRTVVLWTAIALLAACTRTPDDQRIRANIEDMRQAVEARDPRRFLAHVTSDFSGNEGSVDRDGLANLLRAIVFRDEKVSVVLGPIDVDIQGNRATASLIATLTGGQGGLIPEHGAIYSIKSGWRRDGKDWICFAATWDEKL